MALLLIFLFLKSCSEPVSQDYSDNSSEELFSKAEGYFEEGNYSLARNGFEKLFESFRDSDGNITIKSLEYLSILAKKRGDDQKASHFLNQILDVDHPRSRVSYFMGWARLHRINSDDINAINSANSALSQMKQVGEEISLNSAEMELLLGGIFKSRGEFELAYRHYQKSFEARVEILGHYDTRVATVLNNIADLMNKWERPELAIKALLNALRIYDKKNDRNSTYKKGIACGNLGLAYGKKKNFDESLYYSEKSLRLLVSVEKISGLKIPVTLNNLGVAWGKSGNDNKALSYHKQALGWLEKNNYTHSNNELERTLNFINISESKLATGK